MSQIYRCHCIGREIEMKKCVICAIEVMCQFGDQMLIHCELVMIMFELMAYYLKNWER